jgi:HAD superfamily hydrolase (TIGR01509 family)
MLVIFDCDGVLINSEEIGVQEEPAFLAQFGLAFTIAEYVEFSSGLTFEATMAKLDARHRAVHGAPLPADFPKRVKEFYTGTLYPKIRAIEGVRDVLDMLKARNIPFCVASNSDLPGLNEKLRMTGLHPYFDPHIYSKDMVAHGKPAPDLFLYAAQDIGFNKGDCIVVEDSVTGVTAGTRAAMTVLGFSGGSHRPVGYPQTLMATGAAEAATDMAEMKILLASRLGLSLKRGCGTPLPAPP